jgi:hypothetical protein
VRVPADADSETLEAARREIQRQLEVATARAEALVGRGPLTAAHSAPAEAKQQGSQQGSHHGSHNG